MSVVREQPFVSEIPMHSRAHLTAKLFAVRRLQTLSGENGVSELVNIKGWRGAQMGLIRRWETKAQVNAELEEEGFNIHPSYRPPGGSTCQVGGAESGGLRQIRLVVFNSG